MIQAAEQMAQINQDLLTMGRRGHFEPDVDLPLRDP